MGKVLINIIIYIFGLTFLFALYLLFASKDKRIKIASIVIISLSCWYLNQYVERTKDKGTQGKLRVHCLKTFYAEANSYGINLLLLNVEFLSSANQDQKVKIVLSGKGLPNFEVNCFYEKGTRELKAFEIL